MVVINHQINADNKAIEMSKIMLLYDNHQSINCLLPFSMREGALEGNNQLRQTF
jgi:hypothetical protein